MQQPAHTAPPFLRKKEPIPFYYSALQLSSCHHHRALLFVPIHPAFNLVRTQIKTSRQRSDCLLLHSCIHQFWKCCFSLVFMSLCPKGYFSSNNVFPDWIYSSAIELQMLHDLVRSIRHIGRKKDASHEQLQRRSQTVGLNHFWFYSYWAVTF